MKSWRSQKGCYRACHDTKRRKKDAIEQAREAALRLLRYRARSERELLIRLTEKGWEEKVVCRVIQRLKRVGLVDDRALAEGIVQSALEDTRPHARQEVRRKLQSLGIPEDLVSVALSPWTEEVEKEKALSYLRKRLPHPEKAGGKEIARAFRAAAQKGFTYDAIHAALRDLGASLQSED